MRYLTFESKGCYRLAFGSIESLRYTPKEKIQLILGSNGSGKSSLINELTPLPPDKNDYTKDGYKYVQIESKGSIYDLRSTFQPSPKHSFIKDGVELNEGHTAAVQKSLVFKEFGITPDIHALLTDQIKFHAMGPGERRQWFTRLSDINFSYALKVYQKLKDNLRDTQGAIKRYQERAVQEANKLLKPEEIESLKKEIDFLQKWLHTLIERKPLSFVTWDSLKQEYDHQQETLETLSQQTFRYWHHCKNTENYPNREAVQLVLLCKTSELETAQRTVEKLGQSLESQQKTLAVLEKANVTSLDELQQRVKEFENKIQDLLRHVRLPITFDDPLIALQSLLTVKDSLQEVFVNLPEDPENQYTRVKYEALLKEEEENRKKLSWCEETRVKLTSSLKAQDALKEGPATECPNCNHKWHQGFNSHLYEEIKANLKALDEKEKILRDQQKSLTERINKAQEYVSYYRVFTDIVRRWEVLNPVWHYLVEQNIIRERPNQVPNLLVNLQEDLKLQLQAKEYREEIDKLEEARKAAISSASGQIDTLKKDLSIAENEFVNLNEYIRKLQLETQQLKVRINTLQSMENLQGELEGCLKAHEDQVQSLINFYQRDALNSVIQAISLELSLKESQLSKIHIQQAVVADIERELKKLTTQVGITELMVKELSPTEGLIAKGLMGFINSFVDTMNDFIGKVWAYPLELIPLGPSEDNAIDLDYKFQINVKNGERPVPDINRGSEAMKEIIDLAFKLASMDCLGMSDYPVSLDEFARSFDTGHRQSAFNAISHLIQNSDHSQIFIISHYTECYGSLVNSDINVLCGDNLFLPESTAINKVLELH